MSFPWKKYDKEELIKDFYKLRGKLELATSKTKFQYLKQYMNLTNCFFQYERLNTPATKKKWSCVDQWNDKKDDILAKYKKYIKKYSNTRNNELSRFIIYYHKAPAQFSTYLAGLVYKAFDAKKVLDPFAGWGDRCLAAMAMNIDYIGIDSNTNLKPLYKGMIDFFPSESNVKIIFKPCQSVDIASLDFDFVFSSPPYWKDGEILERYKNCVEDYEEFINECLVPVMSIVLKKKVPMCLHLPKNMYNDLKKIFGACDKTISFHTSTFADANRIYCWYG